MEPNTSKTKKALQILDILTPLYPDLKPGLHFTNAFELIVATVLSAQCTDAMVNRVSPLLFKQYPNPEALAAADSSELEDIIHATGFFRTKAKNLKRLAAALVKEHGSQVPDNMEALTKLAGVGRKTAGVVLSSCFNTPAIIVDTHFGRVSRRLGLSENTDPVKLERDIAVVLPKKDWTRASHLLNRHGREYCTSRRPDCQSCPLYTQCPRIGVVLS